MLPSRVKPADDEHTSPSEKSEHVSTPVERTDAETLVPAESEATLPPTDSPREAKTIVSPKAEPRSGISDTPTESVGEQSSVGIVDTRVSAGAPRLLGNFELLSELGHGGMGVVYKARQLNPDRLVALKMILTGTYAAASFRRRFEIEAEAVGNLRHPNIVSLFESGELDGNLYYTMPLIEGSTLSESVEHEEWRLRESVELMKKLADAMAHAHQRGVLHRDLKPSNVLLDKQREPFITDFGLAKITDKESADVTLSGDVMGSPGYMAPEQALGKTRDISTATDVYGLGVIMYQLLTGHPPFRGETMAELLQEVIHTEPARPKSSLGRVDRDLSTICLRCLEKEPGRRYPNAGELAEDLHRWLHGEPIKARAVSVAERTWKWVRRNPLMTAFIVVTVALSSIAIVGIEQQRRLFQQQLIDAKLMHAETELKNGFSGRALAHLADILKIDPQHRLARHRIVEQQNNGVFARALHPPIETGIKIEDPRLQLAISRDHSRVLVLDRDGNSWLVADGQKERWELGAGVRNLRFSADNEWLVASQKPVGVKVWNTKTKKHLFTLEQAEDTAWSEIDPRREWLVTIGNEHGLKLWNATDQTSRAFEQNNPFRNRHRKLFEVDPTGQYALAHSSRQFGVWDTRTLKQVLFFDETDNRKTPQFATFSRDGRLLAWAGGNDIGRVFDVESGELLAKLPQTHTISSMDFNPDASWVVTGGKDHRAAVWETKGGKLVREFIHQDRVRHVEFDASGRYLLTAANDRTIRIWDVLADRVHSDRIPFTSQVAAAGFTSGSDQVIVVCEDGRIHRLSIEAPDTWFQFDGAANFVDFAPTTDELLIAGKDGTNKGGFYWVPGAERPTLEFEHPGVPLTAVFSRDGQRIATRGGGREIRVWTRRDAGDWPGEYRSAGFAKGYPKGVFSPDGQRLVTFQSSETAGQLSLWSLGETPTSPGTLKPVGTNFATKILRAERLVFSPDNQHFACADRKRVELWSVDKTEPVFVLGTNEWSEWLEFSPDGKTLASAREEGSAALWNVETGERTAVLPHTGRVNCIRFSPDSRLVLTAADDKTAQIWSVPTGEPVGQPVEHQARISRLAFSPQGDRFATVSDDRTVRIWDLATRKPLSAPMIHGARGYFADFNHVGSRLATKAANGEVRIWNTEDANPKTPAEELIRAAQQLGRYEIIEDGRMIRIPW